jgi:hypothetical protein
MSTSIFAIFCNTTSYLNQRRMKSHVKIKILAFSLN